MTGQQEWIDQTRRRIRVALWAESLADWLAALLIGLGGAVLLVKLLWPAFWPEVLWLTTAAVVLRAIVEIHGGPITQYGFLMM
ncbi:MAG TPA: hypothetical protein EYP14_20790, partial [Planctomycetaceae bacterium]|nr:hypothetical protein [Planctomycetaceae bacterium]